MTEWLSGLALNIDYTYSDIIKLAIDMGSIDENPTDKLQQHMQERSVNYVKYHGLTEKALQDAHQGLLQRGGRR